MHQTNRACLVYQLADVEPSKASCRQEHEKSHLAPCCPPLWTPSLHCCSGLEAHLLSVATKLQAVSSSVNAGLEKSMVEIMVSVPRMVTEVERVETSVKRLHAELAHLTNEVRVSGCAAICFAPECDTCRSMTYPRVLVVSNTKYAGTR